MKEAEGPEPFAAACPGCGTWFDLQSPPAACQGCGRVLESTEGFVDLRSDPTQDTRLDIDSYDARHGVDTDTTGPVRHYRRLWGSRDAMDVLEIGAGSGNLTRGLLASPEVRRVLATDVSSAFLHRLADGIGDADEKLTLALVDANALPFPEASFTAVVGHSVLHHIARFEATLEDTHRLLRPGGIGIFGEPVLDLHALISLAAAMILGASDMAGCEFGPEARAALGKMAERPARKRMAMDGDRAALADVEDKFQFSIREMEDLGRSIGFSDVRCLVNEGPRSLGYTARERIGRFLHNVGAETSALAPYDWVFEALDESYGAPLRLQNAVPFGFFQFLKPE